MVEALDWGCALRVTQEFLKTPGHVAIRAHHIRIRPPAGLAAVTAAAEIRENVFPCWLAAMTETPFRVTLDLQIGGPPTNSPKFQVQAEVFKQEWQRFRNLPQPWQVELPADLLFLLPD